MQNYLYNKPLEEIIHWAVLLFLIFITLCWVGLLVFLFIHFWKIMIPIVALLFIFSAGSIFRK